MRMGRAAAALVMAAGLGLGAADPAAAANWRIAPQRSELAFGYTADGVAETGRFLDFRATGLFDPKRPEITQLTLTIDMGSIELSDAFRTSMVKSETWFDVKNFPSAEFKLTHLHRVDGSRYHAEGDLIIKGREKPLATDLDLVVDGDTVRAEGSVTFERKDFQVGDDMAGLFVKIDQTVQVRFDLVAERER